ncbi:putative reverse transcriptase domain-containing protein [Tanacetum coccineum]
MNQFYEMKGILRQFSVARTPQQNGVAERRNRTLIEAARTMLADSKLPITFWAEAFNTACYVFDVIVGMDWLSKKKFVIVCHEKVVKIPLEGDEILRVHGERTQGVMKTLLNTKVDESKVSDTSVVRDFVDMFRKICLWPPQRQDKFRIDLVHGATCKKKGSYDLIIFYGEHQCRLLRSKAWSSFEVSVEITEEGEVTLQNVLVTRLDLSTAYHLQADGKSERMIKTLEDIMRACAIDFGGSYHLSIRCALFEALYGRKYRSPVLWAEIKESSLIGPELVQETTDKVVLIKEKLKATRDRQKSYADNRRKLLEFEVGDRVMLKVSPWKGVVRFGKKGKLAPRYVGLFEILERIGLVAYRLRLSKELSGVHDTSHVSNLKKCLVDASLHVPLDEIKVDKTLRFVKEPVEIMDREVKSLKRSRILLVKVRWNSKRGPEFTWEREDYMKSKYPQLFVDRADESTN